MVRLSWQLVRSSGPNPTGRSRLVSMRSHDFFSSCFVAMRVRVGVLRIDPLYLIEARWIASVRGPLNVMTDATILVAAKRRM